MIDKELEILKLIEALYGKERTDEEMLTLARTNPTKIQAWREAFENYALYDVTKAINHYYMRKSSKTRPNIAQITAILQDSGATQEIHGTGEKCEESYGMKYMKQDNETGDMNWLVPEYLEVESLIRRDYYPFVQNIYHPTYLEFRACMERRSIEKRGIEHQFPSKNDIDRMTPEQRAELERKVHSVNINDMFKRIN